LLDSLRSYFGVEKIGDWELNDVKVLLYLHTHKKNARLSSPEKLGDELGISEQTVTAAYNRLRRYGCIAAAPDVTPSRASSIRDPRDFVVTWRGRRALRPFLSVFGLADVVTISLMVFALGALAGILSLLYPSYLAALLAIGIPMAAVFLGFVVYLARVARQSRKDQLVLVLRKPSAAKEPAP
jgi:hypothetical protein